MTVAGERPLYELALTGDEAAFAALIGPLVEPALRLAHSMLGDRWEAEDATQEAITRAWRKLGQLLPADGWALDSAQTIWATIDGGAHWTPVPTYSGGNH